MIEIYECTDCKHCANFNGGDRIVCMHPTLPPDNVYNYHPVGDLDALDCNGFEEASYVYINDLEFSANDFCNAEKFSEELYNGDISYEGIRKWVENSLLTKKKNDV